MNVHLVGKWMPSQESLSGNKSQLPGLECWVLNTTWMTMVTMAFVVLYNYIVQLGCMRARCIGMFKCSFSHLIYKSFLLFNKRGRSYCFREFGWWQHHKVFLIWVFFFSVEVSGNVFPNFECEVREASRVWALRVPAPGLEGRGLTWHGSSNIALLGTD